MKVTSRLHVSSFFYSKCRVLDEVLFLCLCFVKMRNYKRGKAQFCYNDLYALCELLQLLNRRHSHQHQIILYYSTHSIMDRRVCTACILTCHHNKGVIQCHIAHTTCL